MHDIDCLHLLLEIELVCLRVRQLRDFCLISFLAHNLQEFGLVHVTVDTDTSSSDWVIEAGDGVAGLMLVLLGGALTTNS